jgi:hypothetical protein
MPTESFPIAPTVLSVPLHSYGMLAYHFEISDLRSRNGDCDLLRELRRSLKTAIFFVPYLDSNFRFEI